MPTFIHDFWESSTGPCVCKGKSLASKFSPQPYFQFFAIDGGNIQLSSLPIPVGVSFLAVFFYINSVMVIRLKETENT